MSQRRILLIDSDPVFHRLLDEQLRRYNFLIESDPEGTDALARAANAPPALLIISVDEPDKLGYSLCNKAKKGPLAKVPVILATATVSSEGFDNHRKKVKLHADGYLDKRSFSNEELLGKIDNLIGLGEISEVAIPLDMDDDAVEVADDELILDESVSEDDFEPMPTVTNTPEMMLDALLDAETDAAFAALTGLDDEPVAARAPGTTPLPGVTAVEKRDAAEQRPVRAERADAVVAAPAAGGTENATREASGAEAPAAQAGASSSSVGGEDTLRGGAVRVAAGPRAEAAGGQGSEGGEGHAARSPEVTPATPIAALDAALQAAQRSMSEGDEDRIGVLPPRPPKRRGGKAQGGDGVDERRSTRPSAAPTAPPPIPSVVANAAETSDAASDGVPRRARSELDLGLDEVAERADREQSGVFDRRTMQRVADLERENIQLKAELVRARSSTTTSDVGKTPIEREFFALREAMVAKEKELATLRDAMGQKDRELNGERDRLRQLQHAKTTLEAKNQELETRLFDESEKGSVADSTYRSAVAQVSALRQEIDARAQAVAAAESARATSERELAAERQARMAMAAKMEHTVGAERASLEEYYKTELAQARANSSSEAASAVSAALAEAEAVHARALQRAREEHQGALDEQGAAHARALADRADAHAALVKRLEELRASELAAAREEHQSGSVALEQRWRDELEALRRRHAAEIERVGGHHEQALTAATGEREHLAGEISALKEQQRAELEQQRADLVLQLKSLEEQHAHTLEALRGEHEQASRRDRTEGEAGLRDLQQTHQQELLAARLQHEAALAQEQRLLADRTRAHVAAMDERTAAHEAELAELQTTRSAESAQLSAARAELAELTRDLEKRTQQLLVISEETAALREQVQQVNADGERSSSELLTQHAAALAKLRGDSELAVTKARIDGEAALALARAETEAMVTRARSDGEAALAKLRGEHAAALTRTRAEAEATIAKLRADQAAAIEEQHREHQAAIEAESERRTDELRAMQEQADLAAAQLRQHHQQALDSALLERDELRAGLTSARDQLRQRDDELGRLRHTLSAGDQELELHAQAVAERDARIAELRGELETMETESTAYQEQVLKAYQKLKQEEGRVARAKKAVAIALTVLDDEPPAQ